MVIKRVAETSGNFLLLSFNINIDKLFNLAALQAHQVIMMLGFAQFIRGAFAIEVMAAQETRYFKLSEHTIDGRQTDILTLFFKLRENFIGR